VRRADSLTTFMCRLSRNLGASTSWNPKGLSRSVMGLLYLFTKHSNSSGQKRWSTYEFWVFKRCPVAEWRSVVDKRWLEIIAARILQLLLVTVEVRVLSTSSNDRRSKRERERERKLQSFGSLNLKSLIRFSCVYCGLRLYHSLI
jgi:hypothetical protein